MDFMIVSRHILLHFLSFDGHKSIMHYYPKVFYYFGPIFYLQPREYSVVS